MDTAEIIKKVRKIEIRTRRIVDELTAGAYHSVFKGKGMEFNEVREYLPGDDIRAIDWNVTARMGHPYVKKFVEERELTVFLLVDISASGDFSSVRQQKNELAAELAAVLAFNAIRNNDQVGLMLFTSEEELHLRPRKGRSHVLRLIRELLAHTRERRTTDIRHALERFMLANRRRTVVFLISDFIDDQYEQALTICNKKHDVIAMRILDPIELSSAPVGFINVEDAETGATLMFPSSRQHTRREFALHSLNFHQQADDSCRRAGVDLIDIVNGNDYIKPLLQFFRQREKRSARGTAA